MTEPLASWAILGLVVTVTAGPVLWLAWRLDRRERREARRRNMARPMRRPR